MPSNTQPFLASFDARPLLVSQDGASAFKAHVEYLMAHEYAEEMMGDTSLSMRMGDDEFWAEDGWQAHYRPYVVVNGVLQIPIQGTLLNRFPYQLGRWATGYDYIERAVMRGMEDPEVLAIAFVIDSGGGEVAGCFELVDKLYDMRGQKVIRCFAADHAYSAAYALASVGDSISVTRSGGTGSVGVVTAHFNYEKAMDRMGVEVTFIHAGKHKVDGNSYQKLPKEVKARIQARVDKTYGVFTSTVARNRNMDEDAIRGTEALTYDADDSLEVGFADRIGSLEDEMIAFTDEVAEAEDFQMTTKTPKTTTVAEATEGTIDQATHDAAVANAMTEGHAAGVSAEQDRMNTILGSDEAKTRPAAALAAVQSGLDADKAIAMLGKLGAEAPAAATPAQAAAPAPAAATAKTPFEAHMNASDQPAVGATAPTTDGDEGHQPDLAGSIVADFRAHTGAKKKTA